MRRTQRSARAGRAMAVVGFLVSMLSGCSAGELGLAASNDQAESMVSAIADRDFLFCDWLNRAFAASSEPLSVNVEPIYVLDDPVPSRSLIVDPVGSEHYLLSEDRSSVSCDVTGYARDLTYGEEITSRIELEMQAHRTGVKAPEGEQYREAVLTSDAVWLNDKLRVSVSEYLNNASTDYTPLLKAIVDQWHDGELSTGTGAAATIRWDNPAALCNSFDSTITSALFPLNSEIAMVVEAQTYKRSKTPGALGCTFKRDTRSTADRVELVFERYYSEEAAQSVIDQIATASCATVGELYFSDCDLDPNATGWLEAHGIAGTSTVRISGYSWDDKQIERGAYMDLMNQLFENARQLASEAE